MHILISNDDGYNSPGIRALSRAVGEIADVTIVAPDQERSAASNSLTITRPLRVTEVTENIHSVDGTPTDCVHLAVTGLLKDRTPDMVVSGINHGENLGDDVLYSGTVAAAIEGRFQGFPALAVSCVAKRPSYLDTAARVAQMLVRHLLEVPLPADMILNVNVPDVSYEKLRGCRCVRLGHRHVAKPVIEDYDPRGGKIYWVGDAGREKDAGPGTDFYAIGQGEVSVTPLQVDLTRHRMLEEVSAWLEKI